MASELSREGVFTRTVDEAVGFVQQGLSVHVVGPHGSGRSELLGLIADRLDDEGTSILRLFGNPAWRQEPFAALVAAGVGQANAPGPRRTFGDMSAALSQQLRGGRVVVVCDDADDLDLQTSGALVTVHHQRGLVAVTGSRPHVPVGPDLLLLGLTPAVQLDPPVLDVDEVHTMCRALLGGPVDAGALARIATQAAGLPGLVRAIVTIGRTTGTLRQRNGVWTIPGELWTPHLRAAVKHYLADADHDEWEAATTLAVTGPIPLDEAAALVKRPVMDRLLTAGLIHHSGGVVGLFPPLLAEYLRREGSGFARIQAPHTPLAGSSLSDAPRLASGLPSPTSVRIGRAVGADAAVRNQRMVSRAAADVARLEHEWQVNPTPESAMPLLVAMRAAARPTDQIEYVVTTTPDERTFADARMRSWIATWMAVDQNRLTDALAILDEAADRLPDHRIFFEVTRAHVIFMRDRVPTLDQLADVPDSADTELLQVLRVELLLAAGKTSRARELLSDFRPTGRAASGQATLLSALTAVLHGDLDDGIAQARRGYQHALTNRDPGLQQAHAYTAVLGLGMAGPLAEANQLLFDALSASTVASYRDVYHTGLLVMGATIAHVQGRPAYAAALAAQADAAGTGRGPYVGMDPGVMQAKLDDALDLWPLVHDRIERGYLTGALVLALDAVERDADPTRAATVIRLGRKMEGRLLPALADYVAAAASDDEPGLAAVSSTLISTGAVQYAVRADVTRCLLLRRLGRSAEAVAVAEGAWERSSMTGYGRAGVFWRLRDDIGLSDREAEVLSLLSSQPAIADVAHTLQTSIRTVENHVYNIGRKLGASGREPLIRAERSWLHSEPV